MPKKKEAKAPNIWKTLWEEYKLEWKALWEQYKSIVIPFIEGTAKYVCQCCMILSSQLKTGLIQTGLS